MKEDDLRQSDVDSPQYLKAVALKCQYFFDNSIPVHILSKTKRWYNGYITKIEADYIFLNEFQTGECGPIFFLEIFKVERFGENRREDGGK